MISLRQKYGPLALVAGASEGIGAAFSTYLAAAGMDLVLIARRKEPLDQLAAKLIDKYKVHVTCIYCDLSDTNAALTIKDTIKDKEINLLVYNAALSYIGLFEHNSLDEHNKIAFANMLTPLNLVHIFAGPMLNKGKGAIVLMASLAGFQGSGFLATYASTKAFTRIFAESLWYEWKNRGVDVIACCAGAVSTPNFIKTNPGKTSFFAPRVTRPEEVPVECFRHLGKKPSWIVGSGNRIASFFMQKVMPRKMAINIMGDTTRKMYQV